MSDFDPDFSNISQFKQGTIHAWKGPDYKFDSLDVTDIIGLKDGFIIRWSSPEIGFGEYTIHTKVKRNEFGFAEDEVLIEGDSECMDGNEAKTFLKALFDKVLEKINIIF